jgi:hypothetical protein
LDGAFRRRILAEREVRPRPLVVRHVGPQTSTKVPLIEDDDVVQTLAADRADNALDVGILPGRARCGADGRETEGPDRPIERRVEGRVAVVRRNRAFGSSGKASRSCCRVHVDVGCGVTLTCRMRRRSWARTTRTKRSRQVSVGTAKRSMATVEPRWFARNVRHVCEGGAPPERHQPGDRPLRHLES